jgi:hypothetical protein
MVQSFRHFFSGWILHPQTKPYHLIQHKYYGIKLYIFHDLFVNENFFHSQRDEEKKL